MEAETWAELRIMSLTDRKIHVNGTVFSPLFLLFLWGWGCYSVLFPINIPKLLITNCFQLFSEARRSATYVCNTIPICLLDFLILVVIDNDIN